MDLARSRFSDFISVSHDERISHENRMCGILGIICAMISAILIGKSTPQIVTMDLEKEHLAHSIF